MSIHPLPVFEADADPHHRSALSDEEIYARLEPPKTMVVRFGSMKLIGEYPYNGDAKPGCGTKIVARTHRGTELAEMLTTTCENAGCSKSITRQEMLEYIENSGGKDYPFYTNGRVLRVATVEDLNKQSSLNNEKPRYTKFCKSLINELQLNMKLVDAEPILGGELLTFYYMSEERVDFRELVRRLAAEFKTRIEMRQVGARDEARLVADYERCGQHCCCKNFLKVLKPISMRSAKVQKATLDPLKISGRCGRLMCCLRYEDQTYKELKKNLPRKKTRVGTSEGPGIVMDSKILVQLVLVRLEHDNREVAVPVEELMDPDACPKPGEIAAKKVQESLESDPLRGLTEEQVKERTDPERRQKGKGGKKKRRGKSKEQQQDEFRERSVAEPGVQKDDDAEGAPDYAPDKKQDAGKGKEATPGEKPRKKRGGKRRRRGGKRKPGDAQAKGETSSSKPQSGAQPRGQDGKPKRKRRRRRRRGGGRGGAGDQSPSEGG